MNHQTIAASFFLPLIAFLAGCQGPGPGVAGSAQEIVEHCAGRHADVVRLTIHAVPQGSTQACAVASTAADKRGKPSDPEDLKGLATGEETVLAEGDHLDVTLPLADNDGKRTCVVGVTLRPDGRTREQLVARARVIAGEVGDAVRGAAKPLW